VDHQHRPDIDGADALAAQRRTFVDMAAASLRPRPDVHDRSGERSLASDLPASVERVESNSGNEMHPHGRYGEVWDRLQR